MLLELKIFTEPAVLLSLIVLIGMHAAAVFTKGRISEILGYVNIGLHLLLFIPMLDAKFHIEEAVLVYLISFFAYTLLSVIEYRAQEKRAAQSASAETEAAEPSDGVKEGEV